MYKCIQHIYIALYIVYIYKYINMHKYTLYIYKISQMLHV